ncbi:MAG: sulfite dehydrogenase [Burkholderiales bacterium]|nr:sulfite dehydrogenase [Burkholderiales bacterium]
MTVSDPTPVAGGGLLSRRAFLQGAIVLGAGAAVSAEAADAHLTAALPSQKTLGRPFSGYGVPSRFEADVKRSIVPRYGAMAPGNGVSFTPLEFLQGIVTPAGLHFERHHNGVPDIDPAEHTLTVHGLVERPLRFGIDQLLRYPMTSRTMFIECSGNSARIAGTETPKLSCGQIHGLVSCSEWTGVTVRTLLEEAGVKPDARWVVAEGADAATLARSIPLSKMLDDAVLALYQNGERLRPEQGYPLRLVLPGWEGNMSIKWLHRLKLVDMPGQFRDETSHYTDLQPDGKALQFTFPMDVKSVITRLSPGWILQGAGLYEVSGLAWSGHGRIAAVEVSGDGGRTWAEAELREPVLSQCLTAFRVPWQWNGAPVALMSRARDERGHVQPRRADWMKAHGPNQRYHYNAVQAWRIDARGGIENAPL